MIATKKLGKGMFGCPKCEHTAKTEQGVRMHHYLKHTTQGRAQTKSSGRLRAKGKRKYKSRARQNGAPDPELTPEQRVNHMLLDVVHSLLETLRL